ncbi:astacin [Dictyocaulus viviparus]|uniref:Zinc metalloproteinase n=1 Tax=Dictyocaulus viviparus TaxID=29172 RepID=A0A0D8XPM7_DICVI|nr:astacin [Dictyocaulus viviparus]
MGKLNQKYSSILYESDMVLHPDRLKKIVRSSIDSTNERRIKKRKAYVDYLYPSTIWKQGVPYYINPTITGVALDNVLRAIAFWQAETCIDFRPRTNEQQFVEFIGNDEGCWSTVGKDDSFGRQVVSIAGVALDNVLRAIAFWQAETCIDFRPRTNEQQFVEFIGNDEGCWSTVGKDDSFGRQVVSIGVGCEHVGLDNSFYNNFEEAHQKRIEFGVTSHELAHSLGLFHEQSRYDRDATVLFNKNVVSPALFFNFAKIGPKELSTYQLPYDVGSVMHYTPTEFSSDSAVPALLTVDPLLQQTMGQMEGPSFLDVMIMNLHYNCKARCSQTPACLNGGFVDSRNCKRCKCPSGYGGTLCNTVQTSFSAGCGGELQAYEAVRRFDITIKQIGTKRTKQCFYHLKAPTGKRILINIIQVKGRCEEGCWQDGVEFKMQLDPRLVGYRFCCQQSNHRRMLSRTNSVPFIVTSRNVGVTLTFEYTFVGANSYHDTNEENAQVFSQNIEIINIGEKETGRLNTTTVETNHPSRTKD